MKLIRHKYEDHPDNAGAIWLQKGRFRVGLISWPWVYERPCLWRDRLFFKDKIYARQSIFQIRFLWFAVGWVI